MIQMSEDTAAKSRNQIDGGSDEVTDEYWPWAQESPWIPSASIGHYDPQLAALRTWEAAEAATPEVNANPENLPVIQGVRDEDPPRLQEFESDAVDQMTSQSSAAEQTREAVDAVFSQCEDENTEMGWKPQSSIDNGGWALTALLTAAHTLPRRNERAARRRPVVAR